MPGCTIHEKITMPKKPAKLRLDVAEIAFRAVQMARRKAPQTPPSGQRAEKDAEAVNRGARGGKRGGKTRAELLAPEQQAEAARLAARSRWKTTE